MPSQTQSSTSSAITTSEGARSGSTGCGLGTTGLQTHAHPQALNTEQVALLSATLAECSKTLQSSLQSLAAASPETLEEVTGQIGQLESTVQQALTAAMQLMSPGGEANLTELFKLMGHYPKQFAMDGLTGNAAQMVAEMRRQVMTDWAEDVAEYPLWVVSEACRRWRRAEQGKWRPSISEFRALCEGLLHPIRDQQRFVERALINARRKAEFEAIVSVSDESGSNSSKPQRIQLKRTKGWKLPPGTVKVDRTTLFGNPFTIERYEAVKAVELHRQWLTGHLTDADLEQLYPPVVARHLIAKRKEVRKALPKLKGKNLACWCPLPKGGEPDLCHAAVLMELATNTT